MYDLNIKKNGISYIPTSFIYSIDAVSELKRQVLKKLNIKYKESNLDTLFQKINNTDTINIYYEDDFPHVNLNINDKTYEYYICEKTDEKEIVLQEN